MCIPVDSNKKKSTKYKLVNPNLDANSSIK